MLELMLCREIVKRLYVELLCCSVGVHVMKKL